MSYRPPRPPEYFGSEPGDAARAHAHWLLNFLASKLQVFPEWRGDEELRVVAPAIAALRASGIAAEGPYAGDTIFNRVQSGSLDAVVAMSPAAFASASSPSISGPGRNSTGA